MWGKFTTNKIFFESKSSIDCESDYCEEMDYYSGYDWESNANGNGTKVYYNYFYECGGYDDSNSSKVYDEWRQILWFE